jgi:tetratricopeptide (TPR) repeat protein
VHNPFANMVELSRATQAQKERFSKVVETYCADNRLDESILPEGPLKRKCRLIQISAILSRLDDLTDKAPAYYMLGDLCQKNGLMADSELYYSQALQLIPDNAELYNNLGVAQHYQGKLEEAIASYDEALQLKPDHPEAQDNRQKALMQLRSKPLLEE